LYKRCKKERRSFKKERMKRKFKYRFKPEEFMLIELFGRQLIWAFALIGFFHHGIIHGLVDMNWKIQLGVILSAVWVMLPFIKSWRKNE